MCGEIFSKSFLLPSGLLYVLAPLFILVRYTLCDNEFIAEG